MISNEMVVITYCFLPKFTLRRCNTEVLPAPSSPTNIIVLSYDGFVDVKAASAKCSTIASVFCDSIMLAGGERSFKFPTRFNMRRRGRSAIVGGTCSK